MVVVAGDDGHEMPMCVMKRDKGWPSLSLPEIGNFTEPDNRRNTTQFQTNMNEVLVIVGDRLTIEAELNDKSMNLPIVLKFGPSATVRQIKYAIASALTDSPALDSFRIYITQKPSPETHELVGDNKTIEELNLCSNGFTKYKIFIKRNNKEDQTEHRRVCINDIYLQIQVVNSSVPYSLDELSKIFFVSETTTVGNLIWNMFEEQALYDYKPDNINLRFDNVEVTIADANKTLKDVGLDFSECDDLTIDLGEEYSGDDGCRRKTRNRITFYEDMQTLRPEITGETIQTSVDDWVHTADKEMSFSEILMTPSEESGPRESPEIETKSEAVYVGLINQAMTCYLNSLLQALYMTPEFRNALYNWEYIDGSEKDATNSIPYQLQKLFLNLQTSKKSAVETTSLTKSFGWDSTEAWQQHDIQELCRVMFDALEQKFKNTQQADLINRLYEGKMIDYVKCLECGTEKSREDTFLDIPLPVKPFGSTVAYNSVEEALRAFVQPETLDGVNQYFCETCNKKCDAHKGLKFTKFPYILTLHLKRFDFDYNTFHRIKLNDKVTFPDILNVNSLIPASTDNLQKSPSTEDETGTGIKCDDSSTTDSGHLDECLPCDNVISTSEHTIINNEQDDDEGIYISNCPSTSSIHSQENERNRSNSDDCGFYKYDLFSIMIHSGSASGGHYYAYIKDFKTQEWLCFNDQNVSPITYDDIQKTYGGGPTRAFYSGAYSTSTNAYMLMYRQIDYERNCLPMSVDNFPKHIQLLLKQMKEHEEKKNHERARQMYKIRVYCHHPLGKRLCTAKIFAVHEELLSETVEKVYLAFHLDHIVNLDQCRLVNYDAINDLIEYSHDGREDETIGSIIQASRTYQSVFLKVPDMLLEIRRDKKFTIYDPSEITTMVFVVDVSAKNIIDGPLNVRVPLTMSVRDYKKTLSKLTHVYIKQIRVEENIVQDTKKDGLHECKLETEGFYNGCNVFAEIRLDMGNATSFWDMSRRSLPDLYKNMIVLHVQISDTSEELMKKLNIPVWESRKLDGETEKSIGSTKLLNNDTKIEKNDVELTGQKPDDEPTGENEEWQEQSNSEDSSLSDSDRTLVGDVSEDDDSADLANVDQELHPKVTNENNDNVSFAESFFRVGEKYGNPVERLKIYVHKDITQNTLKKFLEPIIKIPVKYFKIVQKIAENETPGVEIRTTTGNFTYGETLIVNLCRAIRTGDFTMRLYLLKLNHNSAMNHEYLCDFVVLKSSTIAQIKRELIVELKKDHNIDIPFERLRLRKKKWKTPTTILLDDMTIENYMRFDQDMDNGSEFFVQELATKEIVTDSCQIVIFAWRYYPDSDKWDDELQEIVLNTQTVTEVKTKLSEISGIPVDKVTFTRGRWPVDSTYQCHRIQECVYQWAQYSDDEWSALIENVGVIFFRDSSEDDPTNVVKVKFDGPPRRVQRVSRTGFYRPSCGPRRERALKIFVDDK